MVKSSDVDGWDNEAMYKSGYPTRYKDFERRDRLYDDWLMAYEPRYDQFYADGLLFDTSTYFS